MQRGAERAPNFIRKPPLYPAELRARGVEATWSPGEEGPGRPGAARGQDGTLAGCCRRYRLATCDRTDARVDVDVERLPEGLAAGCETYGVAAGEHEDAMRQRGRVDAGDGGWQPGRTPTGDASPGSSTMRRWPDAGRETGGRDREAGPRRRGRAHASRTGSRRQHRLGTPRILVAGRI